MSAPSISRFTPSLMEHALLERLFVARKDVLDDVMHRIEDAAASNGRNHTLLVGPRGAGKTHLITLAHHRTRDLIAEGARLQVSWLPEDPWTLISYRHLLAAIVAKLEPQADAAPRDVDALERLVVRLARQHGPIVVFVENLDQILDNLGEIGQQRIRHLLQAERSLLLVASTTRLDRSLSDQASPFYGFFTTTRLEPFDVDEAAAMLSRIAEEKGDDALVSYLARDEGRARLRTVTHLAGGQPRMWAALASALTVGGLDDLVDLLLTRFDDLTPYYQEQLARLAPQQRLVVAELAEADRPINVKDLAERLDLDQRSVAKTMVELVERGWAVPTSSPIVEVLDRRKTFYELAEPMARLAFQIKENRGEPLKLIVDFLKYWFDPHELHVATSLRPNHQYLLSAFGSQYHDSVMCVVRLLHGRRASTGPGLGLLGDVDDALAALHDGEPDRFLGLPSPVRQALEERLTGPSDRSGIIAARTSTHGLAVCWFEFHPDRLVPPWLERARSLVEQAGRSSRASLILVDWLATQWMFEEARDLLDRIAQADEFSLDLAVGRANLAHALWRAGRTDEAIVIEEALVEEIEESAGPLHRNTLAAKGNLAGSYFQQGRFDEALEIDEQVAADTARALGPLHPDAITARSDVAIMLARLGRSEEAIELQRQVVEERTEVHGPLARDTLLARVNLASAMVDSGDLSGAVAYDLETLDAAAKVLGDDDPIVASAHGNLGVALVRSGRIGDALPHLETAAATRESVHGRDHETTMLARANLEIAQRLRRRSSGG